MRTSPLLIFTDYGFTIFILQNNILSVDQIFFFFFFRKSSVFARFNSCNKMVCLYASIPPTPYSNSLSVLLRCDTRPYELGTQ